MKTEKENLYIGNTIKQHDREMTPQVLLLAQLAMFLTMLGTAESLFTSRMATIVFFISFFIFVRCSIYIGKNEKWLVREEENNRSHTFK
jgi:uncharacterized membrane protein